MQFSLNEQLIIHLLIMRQSRLPKIKQHYQATLSNTILFRVFKHDFFDLNKKKPGLVSFQALKNVYISCFRKNMEFN